MFEKLQQVYSDAEALELVMRLMAIPGRSGDEAAVMQEIVRHLQQVGVPPAAIRFDKAHARTPIDGNTGNLIVKLPARGAGRGEPRRMLLAHTDTVPICVGCQPKRRGPAIVSANPKTGLGADDRAGCAVVLATLLAIMRAKTDHPPLTFLWTVQEEIGLHGARHVALSSLGKPALAFNFDGGSPAQVILGATGGYRAEITITGLASHAGNKPQAGVSAIEIAALAIADLVDNGWHGRVKKGRQEGTSNVGVIHGGEATNVVTDHLLIRAEARSHDSAFRERIVREMEKAFRRAAKQVKNADGTTGQVDFQGRLDYDSFRLKSNQPAVKAARAAVLAEQLAPELTVANGGLDANWLTARGLPTVTLGCGQRNIHTVNEQLDRADYQLARRIALRLAACPRTALPVAN